jgi:hypothetical protein
MSDAVETVIVAETTDHELSRRRSARNPTPSAKLQDNQQADSEVIAVIAVIKKPIKNTKRTTAEQGGPAPEPGDPTTQRQLQDTERQLKEVREQLEEIKNCPGMTAVGSSPRASYAEVARTPPISQPDNVRTLSSANTAPSTLTDSLFRTIGRRTTNS